MSYLGIKSTSSNYNIPMNSCATNLLYERRLLTSSPCPSYFSTYSRPISCQKRDYSRDWNLERKSRSRSTCSVNNSSCNDTAVPLCVYDLDKALAPCCSEPLYGISERDPDLDSICKRTETRDFSEGDHIGITQYPSLSFKPSEMKDMPISASAPLHGIIKKSPDLEGILKKESKQQNETNQPDDNKQRLYKTTDMRFKCLRGTKFAYTTSPPTNSGHTEDQDIGKCPCCGNDVEESPCNNRLCSSLINLQTCLAMTRRKRKKRAVKSSSSLERRQQYNASHKEWMAAERRHSLQKGAKDGKRRRESGKPGSQEKGKDGKMQMAQEGHFAMDVNLIKEGGATKPDKPKEMKHVHTMTYSGDEGRHDKHVMTAINYTNIDLTSKTMQKKTDKFRPENKKQKTAIATQTMRPPSPDLKNKQKMQQYKGGRGMAQIKSKIDNAQTQTTYEHVCNTCKRKGKNCRTATTQTDWDYRGGGLLEMIFGGVFHPKRKEPKFITDGRRDGDEDEEYGGKKKSRQKKFLRKKQAQSQNQDEDDKTESDAEKKRAFRQMFNNFEEDVDAPKKVFSMDEIMHDTFQQPAWDQSSSNIYESGTDVCLQNNARVLDWANYFSFVWNRPWIRYNVNNEVNRIPWGLLKNNPVQRNYMLNESRKVKPKEGTSLSHDIKTDIYADDSDYFQFPLYFNPKKRQVYESSSKLHRKTSPKLPRH